MSKSQKKVTDIPSHLSYSGVLTYLESTDIKNHEIEQFKNYTKTKDETMAEWFEVSTKTIQNYRKQSVEHSLGFKEKLLLLTSLFHHGEEVFGSIELFNDWINEPNFYFDDKAPVSFFKTISGIRFVGDRLTGLEYGDNV